MKNLQKLLLTILILISALGTLSLDAQVLISSEEGTADESAMLEIRSTSGGVLIPRMTTGQREAIAAKEGLLVYDITLKAFFIYGKDSKGDITWYNISENAGLWSQNGDAVYLSDPDANVGIGTTNPNKKLVIQAENNEDTLMEIRDKNGNPLVVITPNLTKFNIIKENAGATVSSGGFAVGRYALAKDGKAMDTTLFMVTPDSTRVFTMEPETAGAAGTSGGFAVGRYALAKDGKAKGNIAYNFFTDIKRTRVYTVGQETAGAAGTSGGFAVGRYALAKGDTTYNFFTDKDNTKVIIPVSDTRVGGFSVLGQNPNKAGDLENKFDVSTDTTAETIDGENRVLWYPQKNAFMAGRLYVPHADSVGENSLAIGYQCQAQGDYSTAIGYSAKADSASSFAFGDSAHATRPQSYAFGRGSEAFGKGSFAFGSGAPAGSDGSYNWEEAGAPQATGDYSYAFGLGSVAEGHGAFTMGFKDTASGTFSTAMGRETKARGGSSTAMGTKTTARGLNSMAMGFNTQAIGNASTAMGYGTIAEGKFSTAIGYYTTASGSRSMAMGSGTTASGGSSTAMGSGATASGASSTATGYNTMASGNSSTAMGYQTTASGDYGSTATGYLTNASGWYSTAMGAHMKVKGKSSFGIGLYSSSANADSIMQDNTMAIMGGNVGIGTVAPEAPLDVETDFSGYAIHIEEPGAGSEDWQIGVSSSGDLNFFDGMTSRISFQDGGNVGIGTTAPEAPLDIETNASGYAIHIEERGTGTEEWQIGVDAAGDLNFFDGTTIAVSFEDGGNVGIGTVAPEAPLDVETDFSGYAIHIEEAGAGIEDWQIGVNSLGDLNFFDGTTNRISFRDGGYVGIGTATPQYRLHLASNSAAKPTSSVWTISSDKRLKDIKGKYSKGLDEILKLEPIIYRYKKGNEMEIKETETDAYGFIAQDVKTIFPEAVGKNDKGFFDLDIHPILIAEINAFKTLDSRLNEQKEIIESQNKKIEILEQKIESLIKVIQEIKK